MSDWAERGRLRDPGRGELADAAAWERLEAEAPDEALRRREFLLRTASVAGLAGAASLLPTDTLAAAAAKRQAFKALPAPKDLPIDTFVVLMMENRSFDHYLGWRLDADAKNAGLSFPDKAGAPKPTHRLTPDYQGCGHPDPDHSWDGGRWQLNNRKCDRFVTGDQSGDGSDEFAIGYYLEQDLPFLAPASLAFQTYDRFFCSILSSTYPNRHFMWGAQAGGVRTNAMPVSSAGYQWETIFDRAQSKGVGVGYFNSDLPFAALYGPRGAAWTQPIQAYYERAAAGTLPPVTFVDPPFRDGGGGNGVSGDDHPHGDIRLGQAFMSDVVHAFLESPQFKRGALFVVYDEWGGFFDHVAPPRVPDDRASAKQADDWGQMGFRIPAVAISPYAPRQRISHATCGFESILKLISYRYALGFLNKRHRYAYNIGNTFDFAKPRFDVPSLPDPPTVAASPCGPPGFPGAAARDKEHDLAQLETSGFLERMGYRVRGATWESTFRRPHATRSAHERARRARR